MKSESIARIKRFTALICAAALIFTGFRSNLLVGVASVMKSNSESNETGGTVSPGETVTPGDTVTPGETVSSGNILVELPYDSSYYYSESVEITPTVSGNEVAGDFKVIVMKDDGEYCTETTVSSGNAVILPTQECGKYELNVTFTPYVEGYEFNVISESYNVKKIPVEAKLLGEFTKTYDGQDTYEVQVESGMVSAAILGEAIGRVSLPELVVAQKLPLSLGDKNVGEKTVSLDNGALCELLGLSVDGYDVKANSISVNVEKRELQLVISAADKNFDLTKTVDKIDSVVFAGEGIVVGDVVELNLTADDLAFTDRGNVDGCKEVGVGLKDSEFELELSGGDSKNYEINKDSVEYKNARINSQVETIDYEYENKYVICSGSMRDVEGEMSWIKDTGFKVIAKDGYKISNQLPVDDAPDKISADELITFPDNNNIVTVYAKESSTGDVIQLNFTTIKKDDEKPTYAISITPGQTTVTDGDNCVVDYYNTDFKVEIKTSEEKCDADVIVYRNGAKVDSESGDYEVQHQKNSTVWIVTVSSENAEDGKYTFALSGNDKAGNDLTYSGNSKAVILDTVKPVVTAINYEASNGEKIKEADDGNDYVNADTTLTFTVIEANTLDMSKIAVAQFSDEANSNNVVKSGNDYYLKWEGAGSESNPYTGSVTVGMNGEFGNLQTTELVIVDRAGNVAELGKGTQLRSDKNTDFDEGTGTFTDTFTVDTVKPQIESIVYDTANLFKAEADDGKDYVRENTTLTFTVNEHNLTATTDYTITVNTDDEVVVKEGIVKWSEGDVHKGSISVQMYGDGDSQTTELVIVDRAGNKAVLSSEDLLRCETHTKFEEGTFTDTFTVDTEAPKIQSIVYDTADLFVTADDGEDYVRENTTLTFTVDEHNLPDSSLSITKFDTSLNFGKVSEEGSRLLWIANGDTHTGAFTVGMRDKGNTQTTKLVIVDRAGNAAELSSEDLLRCETHTTFANGTFTDIFTVDTIAPVVRLEYGTVSPLKPDATVSDSDATRDYFNVSPVTVKVKVDEHNINLDETIDIKVGCTGAEDKATYTYNKEWVANGDVYSMVYTLNGDSQYDFTLEGYDRAGNPIKLDEKNPEEVSAFQETVGKAITLSAAVDTMKPRVGDHSKPEVDIIGIYSPMQAGIDGCGTHPLYNTNVTYRVRVYDPLNNQYASGIAGITFNLRGASGVERTVTIAKDGSFEAVEGLTIELTKDSGSVKNLAKGVDNAYIYDITLDSSVFNSNDIQLIVSAVDVSTNKLDAVESDVISIDVTSPTISVHYDNNDAQNDMYFKADRVATITVTERNWDSSCISIIAEGGSVSGWDRIDAGGNGDGTTWIGYVTFTQEGPCSLSVFTVDKAQNAQQIGTEYNGIAPTSFILDKTLPVVNYVFDNNDVRNDKYYMASRLLTVTVTDDYFNGLNDIAVYSDGQLSGMAFSGMTATHGFVSDGVYSVRGTVTDLAGNVSTPFEISEFVVDLTMPTVEFSGIEDQQAYGPKDTFEPSVDFPDTNFYEGGVSFTLIRENWDGQDAPVKGGYAELLYVLGMSNQRPAGRSDLYQLTDISEKIDGLYTLTINIVDQAGNTNNGGEGYTIQFSINRYGSVYLLDDVTKTVLDGYYIADVPEIVIHEYNLSDARESWIDLITSGGERIRLEKGDDYKVEGEGSTEGCSWKLRTYTILADNFKVDGEYTIEIYVKDVKENISTNNDPTAENRGVSINFIRDTEDPSVTLGGPENNGIYDASEMTLSVNYGDNIRMRELIITITDEKTGEVVDSRVYAVPVLNDKNEKVLPEGADEELDIYSGQITYTLKESGNAQVITVTAKDAAGNDTSIEEEGGTNHVIPAISFTLTTSDFVLWYSNKPVFYGTIGGVIGVVLVGMIVLLALKRRKNKEKNEA